MLVYQRVSFWAPRIPWPRLHEGPVPHGRRCRDGRGDDRRSDRRDHRSGLSTVLVKPKIEKLNTWKYEENTGKYIIYAPSCKHFSIFLGVFLLSRMVYLRIQPTRMVMSPSKVGIWLVKLPDWHSSQNFLQILTGMGWHKLNNGQYIFWQFKTWDGCTREQGGTVHAMGHRTQTWDISG